MDETFLNSPQVLILHNETTADKYFISESTQYFRAQLVRQENCKKNAE